MSEWDTGDREFAQAVAAAAESPARDAVRFGVAALGQNGRPPLANRRKAPGAEGHVGLLRAQRACNAIGVE